MRYIVHHLGVPIGSSDLLPGEFLSAGEMIPAPAYEAIRRVVRNGSSALLQVGFFGAAVAGSSPDTKLALFARARAEALHAAALLSLELRDSYGKEVPTVFINLIEPPDGTRVVLLVRFGSPHTAMPAALPIRDAPTKSQT